MFKLTIYKSFINNVYLLLREIRVSIFVLLDWDFGCKVNSDDCMLSILISCINFYLNGISWELIVN